VALFGFAAMGMGTSAIFPLAMSAAAQRQDRSSALNIAALAQFSFMVFLLAPPLLGYVAQHFGIRSAYGIGLPLILLSLLTAGALGGRARMAPAT
jgi:MFS family permease